MSETHTLMDDRLHVYRRENNRFWQCSTYLNGRNHRQSTKETNIAYAREFARDWYLDRVAEDRLRRRGGLVVQSGQPARSEHVLKALPGEMSFRKAAAVFEREYEAMTLGERNPSYVAGKGRVLRLYLNPFFGDLPLSQVTAGRIQEYRLHRVTPPSEPARVRYVKEGRERVGKVRVWKRPSRQTLHNEIVCLRQVLKTANRKGWIAALPDMSAPTAPLARSAIGRSSRLRNTSGSMRRPANALAIPRRSDGARNAGSSTTMCCSWSTPACAPTRRNACSFGTSRSCTMTPRASAFWRSRFAASGASATAKACRAVLPVQRVRKRKGGAPSDLVFGLVQRELLNAILDELDLKKDREGNPRTACSLRHTYICLRLMEGADIYQVAKNCRTSVEMIEKYYASHIANTLDASAINVRKQKPAERRAASDKTT